MPPDLADPLARLAPRLRGLGHSVRWYPEVTSTNDVALRLAEQGAAAGVTVVADAQTAGRGRAGRTWWSPPGAGLYVSVILRPGAGAMRLLTLAAGVATAEGLAAATGLEVHVKWPNDLYVGARKIGGILAESGDGLRHVVVGIGINLRLDACPPDLTARATSIEVELGRAAERGLVLGECLSALDARCRELEADGASGIVAAWRVRAARTFGRPVEWDEADRRRQGTVEDLAADGALLVRTGSGLVALRAGEVRWLG
jgi:BirA family transcriptional regulator, biotin operon repressor / biotin---[acetyl-CoA-carboxylase] ligase